MDHRRADCPGAAGARLAFVARLTSQARRRGGSAGCELILSGSRFFSRSIACLVSSASPRSAVCRLLAWPLFVASLAFIAWSLYVILPPKPRWVKQENDDILPIYVSEDRPRAVSLASRPLFDWRFLDS